jgi:hypothetical protein
MANIAGMGRSIVLALSLLALPIGAIDAANAAPAGAWAKVATNPQTKLAYYIDRATLKKQSWVQLLLGLHQQFHRSDFGRGEEGSNLWRCGLHVCRLSKSKHANSISGVDQPARQAD